jgi:hypothetical protein
MAFHPAPPAVVDLLASDFARRKFDTELRVCEAARRVLCFCRYRRAPEHRFYVRPADADGYYVLARRDMIRRHVDAVLSPGPEGS